MDKRLSDDVRLSQMSPEIKRGVLRVADRKPVTSRVHDPERNPPPQSRPHEPYQPKPFKPVRIKQTADMPAPRAVDWRGGNEANRSMPSSRRSR
jgi:hypothetical protein